MIAAMTGCGNEATTQSKETTTSTENTSVEKSTSSETASEEAYKLDSITLVVDGTFNASLDAGQEELIKQWEDAVGIDLTINQLDHSSYTDGVGRLFASGDYPDVILLNAGQYAEYAKTGLLWDMTEAYDNADFQSRVTLPEVNLNRRINGKQYGIATGLGGGCITYVKKAWLDAVGMKAEDIKDWDSYYAMLKAFATQNPESLTIQTKSLREKWWSMNQAGSFGAFTYWAGYWNDNLVNTMDKNGIDSELVRLEPIAEMDGYMNRESPVYCIIDDGDSNDAREQAIFDAFFETMFDGDRVQMLWVYGAEDVHWSTHAESFTTGEGDSLKEYNYEEGEFHLKLNPADPSAVWKKNAIDPSSMIASMTNGYETATDLTKECNAFFSENCVDCPKSASSEALSNCNGTLMDLKNEVIAEVVVNGKDVDEWMNYYAEQSADMVNEILSELNAQ